MEMGAKTRPECKGALERKCHLIIKAPPLLGPLSGGIAGIGREGVKVSLGKRG